MKKVSELKPNYAPVYTAAMYPDLCEIFHRHGYALAVHGSVARDLDLIAIPWVKSPSTATKVLIEVTKKYAVRLIGKPETRFHGRKIYTFSIGCGSCAIDLSFFKPNIERKK